jgi:hypothetical protein
MMTDHRALAASMTRERQHRVDTPEWIHLADARAERRAARAAARRRLRLRWVAALSDWPAPTTRARPVPTPCPSPES